MSEQFWWHVARSTGIVAWALIALAVVWGLLLSSRPLAGRPSPKWLQDLHRFLGGLAVIFTGLHLFGLVADSDVVDLRLVELLVPFARDSNLGAQAWGVAALYLLVAVQLTALLMKRLPRKWWKAVHYSSFVLFLFATMHAITAGSDTTHPAFVWVVNLTVALVMFLTVFRILTARRFRRPSPAPSPGGGPIAPRERTERAAAAPTSEAGAHGS